MVGLLVIPALLLFVGFATAEPIYQATDEQGRTIYSSAKPASGSAKVAALPTIGKWKPRANPVADATCEKHGGKSCEQGADSDGSVICLDGYRDALSGYSELCEFAKLELLSAPVRPPDNLTELKVSIRNNSAARADRVLVSFVVNKFDPPLLFAGPDKIEPYSIADYQMKVTVQEVPIYRKLSVSDVVLDCGNCK